MSTSKKQIKKVELNGNGRKKRKLINNEINYLTGLFKQMNSDQVTNTSFYKILGQKLRNNTMLFMHKIYPKIRKKFIKIVDFDKFLEIEKKIMKEISFLEGEYFIYEFKGQITQKIENNTSKLVMNDANIYFTNKRMIVQSNSFEVHTTDTNVHNRTTDDYLKKYFLSMFLNRNLYHSRPCFGYEYPILQLHDIRKTRTHVEFTFYEATTRTRMDCELAPQSLLILKEIEKKLIDLNNDEIPIDKKKIPCPHCGRNIKFKHQFCKHCGNEVENHDMKKDSHYFF